MAKFGSASVIVSITDSPGGTPRIITPYVNSIGGIKVENLTQQTNPFGSTSEAHSPTGMSKTPDITLNGFLDDTALVGSAVVLKVSAADRAVGSVGRVLVITIGTGQVFTITVHNVSHEVGAKNGALTEYTNVLRQAGAGVWS
jgi:hypothetical protein